MEKAFNGAKALKNYIAEALTPILGDREAESVTFGLLEDLFEIDKMKVMTNERLSLLEEEYDELWDAVEELKQGVPLQHVTGVAPFYGHKFIVNEHTLVPRPETEELIKLILDENKDNELYNILDIGTGTGCIPISLDLEMPHCDAFAVDISEKALFVARRNAVYLDAAVSFEQMDVLKDELPFDQQFEIIVSNPPYICDKEKADMDANVLEYDPHLALFVPDNDPLLFYKKIADLALTKLTANGKLYFEINEAYGAETKTMLEEKGYKNVEVFKDLNDKDRMVRAQR
ncbi:peptide chain release factor N(5)-glutamine methyltransferase [Persicobacter psychrovividus]|uniref:Release factor glutamine methyltransferase n=1 Tax=Persicobacter psychrovividus TaxID=387638 RepID=A0ABN6L4X2_9BACT|nr:release factor glutamine methyltransferase [Persicobacter psychrovividus]